MSYVSLSVTVVLPFVAEVHNNRALSLEKNSQWLKADQVYQRALQLNPFCVEYYNNRANFLVSQYENQKDERLLTQAEELYKKSIRLNPRYATTWYRLGKLTVLQGEMGLKPREIAYSDAIEYFKNAINCDKYNININYFIAKILIKKWDVLDDEARSFVLERFKFIFPLKPEYSINIYSSILYYTKKMENVQKVIPQTLAAHKHLYAYVERNNLWQFRKTQKKKVDMFRKREEPEMFERERSLKVAELEKIKEKRGNTAETYIMRNEWTGKTADNVFENGNMYWDGTIHSVINVPKGPSVVHLMAKGDPGNGIYPYIIVELDGKEIGEHYVASKEWGKYSYPVDTHGGFQVLSVTYVNFYFRKNNDVYDHRRVCVGKAWVEKAE